MGIYKYSEHKSTLGNIDANVMALIVYIAPLVLCRLHFIGSIAWICPLVIFLIEKDSKLVRFHSLQSLALYVITSILFSVAGIIPFFGVILCLGISLASLIITILMIIKAYNYEQFELPYIGKFISNLI